MSSGICQTCKMDSDCASDGGEIPNQPFCNPATGICASPCLVNANCIGFPGANCQRDGRCVTCTSSTTCGVFDGGEIPFQPTCNIPSGQCGSCTSNLDCPVGTPNCGSGGNCYFCNSPGFSCGISDGPPGGPNNYQPNCDSISGLCVDYCTDDSQCAGVNAPHCQVDRGACVECAQNSHCPLSNWRGIQLNYTTCSVNSYTCVVGCDVDEDCTTADTPACSGTTRQCVDCVYDFHCHGTTPICSSNLHCVQCLSDSHCTGASQKCMDFNCLIGGSTPTSATTLVLALLVLVRIVVT